MNDNYFEALKNFIEIGAKVQENIQKTLVPAMTNIARIVTENMKGINQLTEIIRKAALGYQITEKEVVKILKKYKWFITPEMPLSMLNQIIKIDRQGHGTYKRVNELFIAYFFNNNFYELKELVKKWDKVPLFKKRMKILKDCISFISENKNKKINIANIVLPVLIVQIDGIINDYLVLKTGQPARTFGDIKTAFRSTRSKVLTSKLDNLINDIILDVFLQTSYKYIPLQKPYNFNRHKILHGENIKYGRMDYLIKSFLILDLLSELS